MNRHLRLSLRARLLTGLIAVTTIFLIVLGLVSGVVFGKRLGSVFDGQLKVAAARPITAMAGDAGSYDVYFTPRTGAAGLISPPTAVGQQLESYVSRLISSGLIGTSPKVKQLAPFTINLPNGGPALRAVWRVARPRSGDRQLIVVARLLSQREAPLREAILAEVITGVVLIALLALGGRWLIRRGLAPLDRMATTANQITTRGDLTARMPDSGDRAETGRLTSAINTMLDRIQQAFSARLASEQKVRQFAADASHELRTPLTTIRGYAELYRQGALGPDRLPDAMRRIEQEADRMSRLVAELLELARLDRMTSLDLTETDLALLVHDAVADARAVEPSRPVYAEVPPHLVAVVDEPRIRQILANLLGNVRAYTPPATPTAVRLTASEHGVVLEVADSGPGMSAENAARAFDRFHRGTSNSGDDRASGQPAADGQPGLNRNDRTGSGLGLSIVQAIARAHGGQAALESVPGRGTRVQVWLPTRPTSPQQQL
jgi:two-component system OmpR family sensor kinase